MGSKRYPEHYAKLMDARIEEFVMREEIMMLTAAELDVENTRPTDFPEPRRVWAWVRYPSHAIRVQALAIAYTRTAVKIRFLEPKILIQREGWVWLNAVTPAHNQGGAARSVRAGRDARSSRAGDKTE